MFYIETIKNIDKKQTTKNHVWSIYIYDLLLPVNSGLDVL